MNEIEAAVSAIGKESRKNGKILKIEGVSENEEEVLLDVIRNRISISLHPGSRFPHSMCPEDLIKSLVLQRMAVINREKCAAAAAQGLSTVESPILKKMMKQFAEFGGSTGSGSDE
ncbi:MAG: hypothetical protein GY757_15410 [bacterium]|nr:hypothetical protein [bacterium]